MWCLSVLNFFFVISLFGSGFSSKQNILLIVVDDLRPALGIYGDHNAFTPNIDRLASQSFIFTNAFAQQALCAPSRNSFLTSRRPDSLHLYDFYSYWREMVGNFTTIPQHFKSHGYHTRSFGKVFHPGISSNFTDDYPYSWSEKPFHPKTEIYKEAKVCLNSDGSLGRNLICPVIVQGQPEGTLPDLETLNAAINFLNDSKNLEKPYFLAVGFHKPHVPLKFPINYLNFHPIENVSLPKNRWRPSALPTVAWNPWLDVKNREDVAKLNISFPFGAMPDFFVKKIIQNYNAATSYIDDLVGQLISKIDKSKTIIVLTSDHGWSRSEHGEFSKFSNFDIATRVPLLIYVPNLINDNKPIITDELVELVDLFPTLVDLSQVSKRLEICLQNGSNQILCTEGRSLVPFMVKSINKKEFIPKKSIFTQYPRPSSYPNSHSDRPKLKTINIMGYSIRTNRYRYTEWVKFNHTTFKIDWNTSFGVELYDHLIDTDENLNLISRSDLNYITATLRKRLILGWRYANL